MALPCSSPSALINIVAFAQISFSCQFTLEAIALIPLIPIWGAILRKDGTILEIPSGTCWCNSWVQNCCVKMMIYSHFLTIFFFFLPCMALHSSITGNARALWQFVVKFPSPVSWRLLTAYSWLLCLPWAVIYFFLLKRSAIHLWALLLQHPCPCAVSVLQYCGGSCHPSFSEGEMLQPYPTVCGAAQCCFHAVPTGFPRNRSIRLGSSGKGRAAWSHTSLKTRSSPSWA